MATVSITNPRKDVALLITSVEFDGQMPETRYFHHGIYGRISRAGENYQHDPHAQQLSRPVGSCFLPPGQSSAWQRPMRAVKEGYRAHVTWREVPRERMHACVWFESDRRRNDWPIYEPLSAENESRYSNRSAARNATPFVIVEGDFPESGADIEAPCAYRGFVSPRTDDALLGFPEGSLWFSLEPIFAAVVVTSDKVFFRSYDKARGYRTVATPDRTPIEADLLYLSTRGKTPTIPCLLSPKDFGDIGEVKTPRTEMYFDPGITEVPLRLLPLILDRAQERHLSIRLKRIEPNMLGRKCVLTIGVTVGDDGRQPPDPGIPPPAGREPGR